MDDDEIFLFVSTLDGLIFWKRYVYLLGVIEDKIMSYIFLSYENKILICNIAGQIVF